MLPRRRRSPAIHAFIAAHQALAGTPSGGIAWDIRVSADPRKWRYAAEARQEKFAGTELAKSTLAVSACISWHWATDFACEPWEAPLPAARMIFLGAKPIEPFGKAEQAWLVHTLKRRRDGSRYILQPRLHFALRLGPVVSLTDCSHPATPPAVAERRLLSAVHDHVHQRLHGCLSTDH